jgi:uncharacterized protein YkwD
MNYRFPNIDLILKLHNEARAESWFGKLNQLEIDSDLTVYASGWAEHMSNYSKLQHSNMKNIMDLGYSPVGENIAYGQKDEESVMRTWLRSPGHKRNIMNKSFTHIGCGIAYSDKDVPYWCVCFGKKKK